MQAKSMRVTLTGSCGADGCRVAAGRGGVRLRSVICAVLAYGSSGLVVVNCFNAFVPPFRLKRVRCIEA
eukprot:scaffold13134_cov69-Phaeocystis_antarctica.AAC.1